MEEARIRAIIIDDEERARNSLVTLLSEFCPQVQVIDSCANVPAGVLSINKNLPDLVFLDIEMPEYNGFELLGFFREVDFEFIFVTAYNEHALKAFEVSAVDYLLKPVEIGLLQTSVEKVLQKRNLSGMQERLEVLKQAFQGGDLNRIALTINDGLLFVEVAEIILLEADGAYTKVFLKNGRNILVSKKLRFFEEVLQHRINFTRPHRSFILNLNFLKKYARAESFLEMDNGVSIPISRDNKQGFENLLIELKIKV